MNKLLHKICGALFLLLLTAGLAACNGDSDTNADTQSGTQSDTGTNAAAQPSPAPTTTPDAATDGGQWTLAEMGATIIAAGNFWEEWWQLEGRFADFEWDEEMNMLVLLPDAYFASIEDVRQYLLQTHTDAWVDAFFSGDFPIFAERDGVLYVDGTRAGFSRPRWDGATFELIEQDGNRAVVETTFLFGVWHRGEDYAYPSRAIYRFVLIDGRLDNGLGPWASNEDVVIEALPPTIGQLSNVIRSSMRLWESFWQFEWLTWMHIDLYSEFVYVGDDVFMVVRPESGMENLDGIRNQLRLMYTDAQIEWMLADELAPFREFDGVLHMNVSRPFIYRPDWQSASHVMISQDDERTVVETTVTMVHTGYLTEYTARMRFVFVGRLIDEIIP